MKSNLVSALRLWSFGTVKKVSALLMEPFTHAVEVVSDKSYLQYFKAKVFSSSLVSLRNRNLFGTSLRFPVLQKC